MFWRTLGIGVIVLYGVGAIVNGAQIGYRNNQPLFAVPFFLIGGALLFVARNIYLGGKTKPRTRVGTTNDGQFSLSQVRSIAPRGDRLGGATIVDRQVCEAIEYVRRDFNNRLQTDGVPFQVFQFPNDGTNSEPFCGLWAQVSFNHQLFVWVSVGRSGSTVEWSIYGADLRNGLWHGFESNYFFLTKDDPRVNSATPGVWNETMNVLNGLFGTTPQAPRPGPHSISVQALDVAERLRQRLESLWMASISNGLQTRPPVATSKVQQPPPMKRRRE